MKVLRIILFPLVPIYYFVTWLRNKCYDLGWKSSTSYDIPVICVGNLSVGGTGKSPTIEYLIRLLASNYKVAVLSRGYKRESQGFVIADEQASVTSIGDEPFQFYRKFKDIVVAVDANRRRGIMKLIKQKQPDIILLDDAFQHRRVKAGLNILLTTYQNLYTSDIVLPTGNLREPRSGSKRAQIIIITKCPLSLTNNEKEQIRNKIAPSEHQTVYFSSIVYSELRSGKESSIKLDDLKEDRITLVTGIANPKPLEDHLTIKGLSFEHLRYKDHHTFSDSEIEVLKSKQRIITTEKDYVRLESEFKDSEKLFYLPISFRIDKPNEFEAQLHSFINKF